MEAFYCGANPAERRCDTQCEACAKMNQKEEKTRFFVIVTNYWGWARTEDEAWNKVWEAGGQKKKEYKKKSHLVVEYPADTKIEVSEIDGGWRTSKTPIRVVRHYGQKPENIAKLEAKCAVPA